MRSNRDHLGIGFDVWSGQANWFWFVVNPRRDGRAAIGSAATEADAMREACVAIEEMTVRVSEDAPSPHLAADLLFESVVAREGCHDCWTTSLDRLAEYVATI
jgi:hypothetical protein